MLNVPNLDNLDFETMFERAKRKIPTLTKEWTDLNYHDPGITTLQTFFWLIDSLNFYLNATGEEHKLKYLKLLGIKSKPTPANCYIAIDGKDINLLKGTKVYADDTVFELSEAFSGENNLVVALYNETEGKKRDLTQFVNAKGGFTPIFSLEKDSDSAIYIGFEQNFTKKVKIYIEIKENRRNNFDGTFSLCDYVWECYCGGKFTPCEVISDETCGFLRTGFVELKLKGNIDFYNKPDMISAFYLRCRLTKNEYDILPQVGQILTACVNVTQTNSYAFTEFVTYNKDKNIKLDFAIRDDDIVTIAKKTDFGYEKIYSTFSEKKLCELENDKEAYKKIITFKKENLPQKGDEFAVFVCNNEVEEIVNLGMTDGTAGQRLYFDADANKIAELSLALVDNINDKEIYDIWEYCEDIGTQDFDSKCFGYDLQRNQIFFGDGINGQQPKNGLKVVAVNVKTSMFEDGNVLKGRINRLETPFDFAVTNLENAKNGENRKTSSQLEENIENKLTTVTRAVTLDDFRHIVLNTPGLMIDSLNVILSSEYTKAYPNEYYGNNTVLVAVKPCYGDIHPKLTDSYKNKIVKNLEKYRLLTTDIKVIGTKYVGVNVYGRISLTENTPTVQKEINKFLQDFVDSTNKGEFGKNVDYGKLFFALELHPAVKVISQLSLEYSGDGGYKNKQGDIVIHPDSMSYLQEVEIEYLF